MAVGGLTMNGKGLCQGWGDGKPPLTVVHWLSHRQPPLFWNLHSKCNYYWLVCRLYEVLKEHILKCKKGKKRWQLRLLETIMLQSSSTPGQYIWHGPMGVLHPNSWSRNRKTRQPFRVADWWGESGLELPAMSFMAPYFAKPWKILNIWTGAWLQW